MVDFQSRDTDRGYGDDEDEDEEAEADEPAEATESGGTDDADASDSPTESADGESAGTAAENGGPTVEGPDHARTADSGAVDAAPSERSSDPLAPSSSDSPAESEGDSRADASDPAAEGAERGPPDGSGTEPGERSAETGGHAGPSGHDHSHPDSGGHDHGHAHAADVDLLGVAVVTVSSTRTREDDPSGDVVEALIEAADHEVVTRDIIRDDLDGVQTALLNLTGRDDVDVVVTTGGTGVTPDDVTVEGARPLFDRELPGFGELFRILSYEEIGTRAMASRTTAGMVDGVPVFCLPGSEAAARLGTEELVVEEMGHLVALARRDD